MFDVFIRQSFANTIPHLYLGHSWTHLDIAVPKISSMI